MEDASRIQLPRSTCGPLRKLKSRKDMNRKTAKLKAIHDAERKAQFSSSNHKKVVKIGRCKRSE